jgi:hypothetical protein
MFRSTISLAVIVSLVAFSVHADDPSSLKPLMAVQDQVVFKSDFSKVKPIDKEEMIQRQGTRWVIEDGVLKGQESSQEYQAKKEDHFGYEPRLSMPVTPNQCVASFSFRFIGGNETSIAPFIEFGHHIARMKFSQNGAWLLSDHDTMKVAEAKTFKYESGKWYHAMAELKGKEFVFQIKDGPTLYAKRDAYAQPVSSGGKGFGITGPKHGKVELDNITLWSIKEQVQPEWEKRAAAFPEFTPIQIKKPKAKKPKK